MFLDRFRGWDRARLVRTILHSVLGRVPTEDDVTAYSAAAPRGAAPDEVAGGMLALLNPDRPIRYVPPGHHYSPITPKDEVERHFRLLEARPVPESLPGIVIDQPAMVALWREFLPLLAEIPFRAEPRSAIRYALDNPAYAWGDGQVLYSMIRRFRPRRIVEVGSGWSTICTLDTVALFLDGECTITLIEPYPKLVRDLIGLTGPVPAIIDRPVQDVPLSVFEQLGSGDILFIDSTHVVRTGGDVCWELFEILPRLKPGVFVHFHDIFWPFEYPRAWAADENRSWNEIYALRAYLTGNHAWRIVMFNDYLSKLQRPLIESTYPAFLRNPGGALWLRKALP